MTLDADPDPDGPVSAHDSPVVAEPLRATATDRWPFLRGTSPAPTWAGLIIAGTGFAVLFLAWGRVAGETTVAEQLPHVGLALVALAVIMVGLVTVTVQSKRQDAAALQEQLEQLANVLGSAATSPESTEP